MPKESETHSHSGHQEGIISAEDGQTSETQCARRKRLRLDRAVCLCEIMRTTPGQTVFAINVFICRVAWLSEEAAFNHYRER